MSGKGAAAWVWYWAGVLGRWGVCALLAALLGAGVAAAQAPGLLRAVRAERVAGAPERGSDERRLASYRESFGLHLAQLNGRSAFYIPPPPPPPPPPARADDGPAREPPPPERYAGPAIIAMVGETVWLDDGTRLTPLDAAVRGIRVVSVNPPWGARLEWRGREFDVPLFDRTTPIFLLPPGGEDGEADWGPGMGAPVPGAGAGDDAPIPGAGAGALPGGDGGEDVGAGDDGGEGEGPFPEDDGEGDGDDEGRRERAEVRRDGAAAEEG